ncbi:uncharacterized protein LOC128725084 [Anopheles nili]|uniref:uncharacterized protein LOC128725084 n=1 Tax=Anopheles nili TaxID=185578 RepID=UPI00237B5496|nr:uncharacterized protein LOC128725084 [Anopheles nili]
MKPIYYLSKVTGLWPYSLLRSSPGVTVLDIAYMILVIGMYVFCLLVNTNAKLWDYYMKPFESNILRYGLQTHLVNGLFLGVIVCFINVVQYRKKWEYMELLDNITKVVEQEFHVKNPVQVVQMFISVIILAENGYLWLVLIGYYYLIDRTLEINTTYLYASYYLMNISLLSLINEFVSELKIDNNSSTTAMVQMVNRLSVLHFHLCDAIRLVNRICSFQLMLHFGAMFVFLVFGLFTIYKAFNSNTWAFKIMAMANGSWIGFYLLAILVVINATSAAQSSGQLMGDIVHEIIRKQQNTFSTEVIERLSILSLQVKMRDMSFSCGLFYFDWNLLGSMLAALAMYLVFLIQFDVSPPVGLASSNFTIPSIEIIQFERD